jgi:hypothetical protein
MNELICTVRKFCWFLCPHHRVDVPVVGQVTNFSNSTDRENLTIEVFKTVLVYYHWLIYLVSIFKKHNC